MLIEFILYLLLKYVFDTSCLFQLFCDAWISITLLTSLSKKIIIPIKNLIRNENYLICAKPFFCLLRRRKKIHYWILLIAWLARVIDSTFCLPFPLFSLSLYSLSPPFSLFSSPLFFYSLFPKGFLCFHLTLVKESFFSNTFFYQCLFSIVSNSIFLNYLSSFLYNYNILLSCLFFLSYLVNAMSFSLSHFFIRCSSFKLLPLFLFSCQLCIFVLPCLCLLMFLFFCQSIILFFCHSFSCFVKNLLLRVDEFSGPLIGWEWQRVRTKPDQAKPKQNKP